jgi:hypothetical protein
MRAQAAPIFPVRKASRFGRWRRGACVVGLGGAAARLTFGSVAGSRAWLAVVHVEIHGLGERWCGGAIHGG